MIRRATEPYCRKTSTVQPQVPRKRKQVHRRPHKSDLGGYYLDPGRVTSRQSSTGSRVNQTGKVSRDPDPTSPTRARRQKVVAVISTASASLQLTRITSFALRNRQDLGARSYTTRVRA
jgi:hypothetical protein